MVSTSPIWIKIGDFGLAKLARDGSAFRTEGGTRDYVAPEAGIDTRRETSEYTNAIDIWALGCITHEILTQTLPFRGLGELSSYCLCPKLPRNTLLEKNISKSGIEFVERALAYPPECRITSREALELEWLRPEDNECELQRLLRDDEALSEEVAVGLIKNLRMPYPGGHISSLKKDILFPACLINIISSEIWNNGFRGRSERFLANVMRSIRLEVMVSEDTFRMSGPGSLTVNSRATAMMPYTRAHSGFPMCTRFYHSFPFPRTGSKSKNRKTRSRTVFHCKLSNLAWRALSSIFTTRG